MVNVAINGFGRIGRAVFRIIATRPGSAIRVVAINDLSDDDILAYLLEYDSVMGRFDQEVTVADGIMKIGHHEIQMLMERDPAQLPWAELGVDIVIESTGVFRDRATLQTAPRRRRQAGDPHRPLPGQDRPDRGARSERRRARRRRHHRLQRLLHHQLPGPPGQGSRRQLRDRQGRHDHGPRLHQRPGPGRCPPQGPPSEPGCDRKHHPHHHRRRQGGRRGAAQPRRASWTGSRCECRCPTDQRSTSWSSSRRT